MTVIHLFILQICACAVPVFGKRLDQLEKKVQAIQSLAFQDIQILKETVDRNSLKIDNLTELVNRTMEYITDAVELTTDLRHGQDGKPMEKYKNDNYQMPTVNQDVKRLKRAFQEQKMYSISLQENMLAEVEKAVHRVKDALIKNITGSLNDLKSEIKEDLDEMRSDVTRMISDVNFNTSHMLIALSRDQSYTKMQTDEILNEVNSSRYMISDMKSAANLNSLQVLKKCSNVSDKLVTNRFETEKRPTEHTSTMEDRLSTGLTNLLDYLRINPDIRFGDARVSEDSLAGRVEVLYNGIWGTVCNDDFNDVSATVACRMAGFKRGVTSRGFDGGSGAIWLDDVECTGSEINLFDCPRRKIGVHDCDHDEDIGVRCF